MISNAYVAAHLLLAKGRRRDARAEFKRCAAMDVLRFSPLLASKTIDASWQAGLIATCDGDVDGAAEDFRRGIAELVRVLDARDWVNILGSAEEPLTFGLVDLQQAVEFAARCAFGVACAPMFLDRPGLAWQLVRRRTLSDLKRWSEQQTGAMEWLREQKREYERALGEAREWVGRQEQGRAWLEQNAASLSSRLESLAREAGDERERLRGVIEEQRKAAEWQAGQRRELEGKLRERDALIGELRGFVEAQKRSIEERVGQKDARIVELQATVARLTEGRDWLLRQRDAIRTRAAREGGSGPQGTDQKTPQ